MQIIQDKNRHHLWVHSLDEDCDFRSVCDDCHYSSFPAKPCLLPDELFAASDNWTQRQALPQYNLLCTQFQRYSIFIFPLQTIPVVDEANQANVESTFIFFPIRPHLPEL